MASPTELPDVTALLPVVTLPLGAELLFRGLVHGELVATFSTQRCGGAWFLSVPAILCGVLYALGGLVLRSPAIGLMPALVGSSLLAPLLGALVLGVAAAIARERSESITASLIIHWAGVAAALLARGRAIAF
jgi:membrane protease YdiL (CAAX protease family)